MKRYFLRVGTLLALLPPAAAVAQQTRTPDIIVTGRGLEPAPSERAYGVVTFDRQEIDDSPSQRLEDVLRTVAGLQQFRRSDSRSAHPTSQGIVLRGLGGNAAGRALLILDGVPQADPFGGWVPFPAYALDRLASIRVQRGGGSGFAGPGALAGTIELESVSGDALTPLTAEAAWGSRSSIDANATASFVSGPGFATLSAGYGRSDGFIPTVAEDRGAAEVRAPNETMSAAFRGVVSVGAATELQANLSAFSDDRTRGVAFTDVSSEGADASMRLVGHGQLPWSALAYVQTRGFSSGFASVDAARNTASAALDQYNVPSTGLGGRVELAPRFGESISLRVGADVRAVSGRTQELYSFVAGSATRRRVAGGRSVTYGGFMDASLAEGPLTLNLGGRVDWWTISDGSLRESLLAGGPLVTNTQYADRSGTEVTGRAGIAVRIAPPLSVRGAIYRGWRLPTLNELYRPFRVGPDATAANALLTPERVWGYEGGIDFTPLPGVTLALTGFDNQLDGAIANATVGRGPGNFPGVGFVAGVYRVRQNVAELRSRGVEVEAYARLGNVTARASYAYIDARIADPALDGLRPAQTPEHQASASLSWRNARGYAASLVARHVGDQFEDDQNLRALAAATTFDARVAVPVGPMTLEARGENLADARIEAGLSPDGAVERAAPRTLWIGARFTLQ